MRNSVQRSALQVLSILFEHRGGYFISIQYSISSCVSSFEVVLMLRRHVSFSSSLYSDRGSSLIFFRGGSKTVG